MKFKNKMLEKLTWLLLFVSHSTLAAPGTPNIAWMETNYNAPAQYNIKWNMWWGGNGDQWHLMENGVVIHTGNLTPNNQNAQKGDFSVTQNNGGTYEYQIKLCDSNSGSETCSQSAKKTIVVVGGSANQPPIANAGNDQSIEKNSTASLSGSYTDDGVSTPISVAWSQVSGPGITSFNNAASALTTATFSEVGTYQLRLTISDNEFTDSDEMLVTVSEVQVNQPPVANAGSDLSVQVAQPISLNGTYTDDGRSSPVTQTWLKVSGTGDVIFSNANQGNTEVTFSSLGAYVLSYRVHDGELESTDLLNVEVIDSPPPETPSKPAIAWLPAEAKLVNGVATVNIKWNMYWGSNGNEWRLQQDNQVVHTDTLSNNSPAAQTGSFSVTLTKAKEYLFLVSLCQVVGSQESCNDSASVKLKVTGGVNDPPISSCENSEQLKPCIPNRADPVDLKVKGWPSTLAMGTVTDNDLALNASFAEALVDSIFKYEGDGTGNRGALIEPSVTLKTIQQSREIESINGRSVKPTMVVYTANASGGGVASEDILDYENLVMHYQNLIRMTAVMQAHKDTSHVSPASVILNADLLGEWQTSKATAFKTAYGDVNAWNSILVRKALKEAITKEVNYQVVDGNGGSSSLNTLYNLTSINTEIDGVLEDNIKGWVQSQNLVLKLFSPDVSFGWVINLWNPGSANWTHTEFSGLQEAWDTASQSTAGFIDWIGAYENNEYQPDFVVFDKYERDGFSPDARGNYAFGAKEWENYLNYVKQVTDHINIPAMIWQIPGGHMATTSEDIGNYDLVNHSASAASYFMGDKSIGKAVSNIRNEVLNISLNGSVYDGATSVSQMLQQTPEHDWGLHQLRRAAFSNVFSIMWGGGSTTAVIPIATNGDGDNNWLKNKIVSYQSYGKIPLYYQGGSSEEQPLTSLPQLNSDLESISTVMDNEVFLFQTPSNSWVPSSIYKWADFLDALNPMHNTGVENVKFWLIDPLTDDATNIKYAKVAIAAFLAQSMKETIQFDACDENNWSLNTGEPVNYPISSSCGQLGQVYADYGTNPSTGADNPYSCPRNPKMEISALTHAKWYGAPAPLFVAPDSALEKLGLLVNGNVGYWSYSNGCSGSAGTFDPSKQTYQQDECAVYPGQKAGKFIWNGAAAKSIEGCGWWGRGVIQTTGRLNFGKLNHFIGRSHVAPENVGQVVEGILVNPAPEDPLYADLDLCFNPELVCSTQEHKEIKWIAGIFFWMNEVQGFNDVGGPYADWNYFEQLKAFVDGGMVGTEFIDDVSGIVNRGCPDKTCPVSGAVDGLKARSDNFKKVLNAMGINLP